MLDCSFCSLSMIFVSIFLCVKFIRAYTKLQNLEKRHVFITGCDSGFGKLLAVRLDKKGIPVYAGCLLEKSLQELKDCCSSRLKPILIDVTDTGSVQEAAKYIDQDLGNKSLWAIVNNAGTAGPRGSFELTTKEDCLRTLQVNLLGVYDVTLSFLPLIKRGRQGRVINIASVLGRISCTVWPYSISKYAVEGLSDGLSYDLDPFNITVHTLEPGLFKTNLTDVELAEKSLMRTWKQARPEIREEYGGDQYIEEVRIFTRKLLQKSSSRTDLVVDAYEHALFARYPHNRYHVGMDSKYFFIPLSFLPLKLQMLIFNTAQAAMGNKRPIPKNAVKF